MMYPDDWDFFAISGLLLAAVLALTAILLLSGCVEHRVTAPQLDTALQALQRPACPPLMPIPARMLIDIDGADVTADIDGEAFLRRYVAARDCLRGAR